MPVYTYECREGHRWDEVRETEGSEASEEPCRKCLENCDKLGVEVYDEEIRDLAGKKVPSCPSVSIRIGATPKFYPNREGK